MASTSSLDPTLPPREGFPRVVTHGPRGPFDALTYLNAELREGAARIEDRGLDSLGDALGREADLFVQ